MIWVALILLVVLSGLFLVTRADPRRAAGATLLLGVLGLAVIVLLGLSFLVAVPAGHTGVAVVFGKVQPDLYPEGLRFKNPFADVEMLSVRTETYTMSAVLDEGDTRRADAIIALSSDGLRMPLDVTVAYRLVADDCAWVYRNLGRYYENKIVRPAARTAVREATSRFTSQEAYATKREELAQLMQALLAERISTLLGEYDDFSGRAFIIQQVMLRNVDLPGKVKEAIEEKLAAEQDALRMQFILAKERQEAERKRIEAAGIADFQKIVSEGISGPLLQWKGIEATMEIARSPNAKTVIVGSGKGGLPIILNPGQ